MALLFSHCIQMQNSVNVFAQQFEAKLWFVETHKAISQSGS